MPFSMSDTELRVLMRLAEPVAPRLRGQFMETVAAELQGAQGDGATYRIARDVQRRFLNASGGPLPAVRSAARVPHRNAFSAAASSAPSSPRGNRWP
jgi:hypothetical protein